MKPNDEGNDGILISRRTALVASARAVLCWPARHHFNGSSVRGPEWKPSLTM
jgi:hypothetical protein